MPLQPPLDLARASRARPVRFQLPGGSEITIAPPSLDQVRACLALDPAGESETPLEETKRLARQFQILVGPEHAGLTATLDKWQIIEITTAVYVAACGMDAEAFARWQLGQREISARMDALEMIEQLEDLSAALAAELHKLPAEVGAQPMADLVALREALHKQRVADLKVQAALHDKKLS